MAAHDLVPAPHDVLASDAERERVVDALRDNAAGGRLDADELEQRLGLAYSARIRADLLPLVADLPSAAPPAPRRRPRASVPALPPFVFIALMLVTIWALSGGGYFWPVWPIAAMAFGGLRHGRYGRRGACGPRQRTSTPAG
jgi:uncharacterized protein DUF1707